MAFFNSPGVKVAEVDLSTTIPTTGVSDAAFVGSGFTWGPVNTPVTVGSENELVNAFGKPVVGNKDWFTAASFLAYGGSLQIVRVADNGVNASNGNFKAKYPGTGGNGIVVKTSLVSEGTTVPAISSGNITIVANSGTTTYDESLIVDTATDITLADFTALALEVGTSVGNLTAPVAGTVGEVFTVIKTEATVDESTKTYQIEVVSADGISLETFSPLAPGEMVDEFGANLSILEVLKNNNRSDYIEYTGDENTGLTDGDENILANGTNGDTGTNTTAGYTIFEDTDKYDVDLVVAGSNNEAAANLATSREDCVAFVSASGLSSSTTDMTTAITTAKNGISPNSYVFMDSGSKKMYDKYNDTYISGVPLNGDIAGLCVRTDNSREPWYSPAGFNRGQLRNVVSLDYDPNKTQRDELYKANINPVSTFPGQGVVLFGDKTLQSNSSAFDRINVRRLFNIIEKQIKEAAKFSLFEFNDEFTRSQFRSIITPYLRDIKSRRGISDFLVVCDDSNNTAQIIDSNQFIGDIFIKPNRSVNFIQLNFVAVSTGVSFNEVVGAV